MQEENITVNGLWIGTRLSNLELLTVKSFQAHGHRFMLWLYDELEHDLPEGTERMDATLIIPREKIFRYSNSNQFGHGKGSVSGFSDIFRYKLLSDYGGWWVDMDVTCLKPLDVETPYYFRPHHELLLVGNVMKCPRGSELMKKCYEEASMEVHADNTDWHKPIEILASNVEQLHLQHFIRDGHSMEDHWNQIRRFLYQKTKLDSAWWFVHWMNEEWRSKALDKNDFMINSAYGQLLVKHGLVEDNFGTFHRMKNTIRFVFKRFLINKLHF